VNTASILDHRPAIGKDAVTAHEPGFIAGQRIVIARGAVTRQSIMPSVERDCRASLAMMALVQCNVIKL
jgi:hypothetical protein